MSTMKYLASTLLAAGLLAGVPAQAALQTWIIKGSFDAANGGQPLPSMLEKAFPSGSRFTVEYVFDDAAPALNIYDGRKDFVTAAAQGGQVTLTSKRYVLHTGSSRVITELLGSGSRLTLNANEPASGGPPRAEAKWGQPGLDSLVLYTASGTPWFNWGHSVTALPDLGASQSTPTLDVIYFTPTGAVHRIGIVSSVKRP